MVNGDEFVDNDGVKTVNIAGMGGYNGESCACKEYCCKKKEEDVFGEIRQG